jgi:hypothetical protein
LWKKFHIPKLQNKKDYCDVQHFHWLENKKSFFISNQKIKKKS